MRNTLCDSKYLSIISYVVKTHYTSHTDGWGVNSIDEKGQKWYDKCWHEVNWRIFAWYKCYLCGYGFKQYLSYEFCNTSDPADSDLSNEDTVLFPYQLLYQCDWSVIQEAVFLSLILWTSFIVSMVILQQIGEHRQHQTWPYYTLLQSYGHIVGESTIVLNTGYYPTKRVCMTVIRGLSQISYD